MVGDTEFEPDETFTVTLPNASGDAISTTATAAGIIENDDAAPIPAFSIAATDAVLNEGDPATTEYTFTVTRGGNTSATGTVEFAVSGTGADAADAQDFSGGSFPSGTVSFDAGDTTETIVVSVVGDADVEPDESFQVTLSNASDGGQIVTTTATGTIEIDDLAPTVDLSILATDAVKAEGNSGSTAFTFTVARTGSTAGITTADFVVSGSAVDAADFGENDLPAGTVTFPDGSSSQTITIVVVGDSTFEPDESFTVTLSSASGGATVSAATATGISYAFSWSRMISQKLETFNFAAQSVM
ncbi:MAG: Calx-beta domain-containing protein [Planctomycetota bacterium]